MTRKSKYPTVSGYWVYVIYIPSVAKYYVGVSKQKCGLRWKKASYKTTVLKYYFSEWDSMVKTVLIDELTREEALKMEDDLIQALRFKDLCINELRSGLITKDESAYLRELRNTNTEYREKAKQRCKQWRLDNPEYMKQYMKQYNKNNKKPHKKKATRANDKRTLYFIIK